MFEELWIYPQLQLLAEQPQELLQLQELLPQALLTGMSYRKGTSVSGQGKRQRNI
jgi:hypothetical protein